MVTDGAGPVGLAADVHVRFSFLVRNPALTAQEFRAHYRDVHGPLAAAQAGFRKYTTRYVQNHVREVLRAGEVAADGITATTQVPRADYGVGFFDEPDYPVAQRDERYLFDVGRTRSVVGRRVVHQDDGRTGTAVLALRPEPGTDPDNLGGLGARAWSVFAIDTTRASALGFGAADFHAGELVRAVFADAEVARAVVEQTPQWTEAWLVDELQIFGPPSENARPATERGATHA